VANCDDAEENGYHYPIIGFYYKSAESYQWKVPLQCLVLPDVLDELRHMLKIMTPKIAFCSTSNEERLGQVQPEIESLEKIVVMGNSSTSDMEFSDLLKETNREDQFKWTVPVPFDGIAALLCSSGTSGLPKCVQITFQNLHTALTGYS